MKSDTELNKDQPHVYRSISHIWIIENLLWIQALLWALVVMSIFVYGYRSIHWSEAQVFFIEDGLCNVGPEGIGRHCFGDFGLPYNRGFQASPYVPGNLAGANTPLTALGFEGLRLFPYNTSLAIYLAFLALCLVVPFIIFKSYVSKAKRIQLAVFFGLVSAGGVAVLDRGNHVVVFVPLLVAYLLSIEKRKWLQAAIFLTLMSMLKFWGLIFVVALLARSKFRYALGSMFAAGAGSILILAWFPGKLSDSVINMLRSAGNQDYSKMVSNYALSVKGFIGRIDCFIQGEPICNTATQTRPFISNPLLGLVIAIILLVLVYVLMRVRSVPPILWMSVLISLGILAVPDGPIYQASLITAIVALLTLLPSPISMVNWKWSSYALILAIILSSVPLTVYVAGEDYPFRSYYLTIPVSWLTFIAIVFVEVIVNHRKSAVLAWQQQSSTREGQLRLQHQTTRLSRRKSV